MKLQLPVRDGLIQESWLTIGEALPTNFLAVLCFQGWDTIHGFVERFMTFSLK